MTAEIAILNRSAIALAADSAVTIGAVGVNGHKRVWKSANKIFSLSPENDIGVMIFGSGDFCGIPWETILKLFAQQRNQRYDTVAKCKADFVDFVISFPVFDAQLEELNSYLLLLGLAEDMCHAAKGPSKTESKTALLNHLKSRTAEIEGLDDIDHQITSKVFDESYSELIYEALRDKISFVLSASVKKSVSALCRAALLKTVTSNYETGIVFGGFGKDEFFPCLSSVMFDGKTASGARWWGLPNEITMDRWKESTAFIQPFAQGDIAHFFIEGIEEGYIQFLSATLLGALSANSKNIVKSYVPEDEKLVESVLQEKENEAAIASILEDFRELRRKKIVSPMLNVVQNLPKEEMAAMAESLVEVTSLRRRMDSDVESVAGPVDVCVISKGDGLVWIKRKHYFDAAKNSEFPARREKRRRHDQA